MGTSRDPARGLIAAGVACLVVSSVCDGLRGPALPLVAGRFAAPWSRAALFLTAGSLGAFLFNLAAMGPLERLGDRALVRVCCALQALAMLAAAAAPGLGLLSAAGFFWGAGNSGLGMCANLLVIRGTGERLRARALSLLHVTYGAVSILPPLYVAAGAGAGWGLAALFALPALLPAALWGAAVGLPEGGGRAVGGAGGLSGIAVPDAAAIGAVIALYVTGEVLVSSWLPSLAMAAGADLTAANRGAALFFVCLGAGRGLAALWLGPGLDWVATAGMAAAGAGVLTASAFWPPAAWLSGLAMAPVFPCVMARVTVDYPRQVRGLLAFAYAAMTAGIGAGHLAMGRLAEGASPAAAFRLPAACLLGAALVWHLRRQPVPADSVTSLDPAGCRARAD